MAEESSEEEPASGATIGTLAIPSAGRPALAMETLRGYLDAFARAGRRVEAVVVDTSVRAEDRRAYREGLRALARETGAVLRYFGQEQLEAYAQRMAAAGVDPELVWFAGGDPLGTGQAYGAARNRVLLDTLGGAVLSVDDDVRGSIAPSPRMRPGIRLFTGDGPGYVNYDPHEYWFYDDRAQVLASHPPVDVDLLALHERCLGRGIRELLAEHAPGEVDDRELLDPARRRAVAGGRGHVPITFLGLRGDAGMYAPTWHLLKTGASRERLMASEDAYRRAIASRELVRCVPRLTLSDGRWYQGTMIGLDNRTALPPTLPVMRYEDGVFRIAVHRTRPEAWCAHLPWTALHDRPGAAAWEPGSVWKTAAWTRMGELVVRLLLSAPLEAGLDCSEARLRALGRHLVALASLPVAAFFEVVEHETRRQKACYVEHLEQLLVQHDHRPRAWADDVRRHLELLSRSLGTPALFVPLELRERHPLPRARERAQDIVRRYGRLLEAWPELVAATRAGSRPSVAIEALDDRSPAPLSATRRG
jgi:hypothetical protein